MNNPWAKFTLENNGGILNAHLLSPKEVDGMGRYSNSTKTKEEEDMKHDDFNLSFDEDFFFDLSNLEDREDH